MGKFTMYFSFSYVQDRLEDMSANTKHAEPHLQLHATLYTLTQYINDQCFAGILLSHSSTIYLYIQIFSRWSLSEIRLSLMMGRNISTLGCNDSCIIKIIFMELTTKSEIVLMIKSSSTCYNTTKNHVTNLLFILN